MLFYVAKTMWIPFFFNVLRFKIIIHMCQRKSMNIMWLTCEYVKRPVTLCFFFFFFYMLIFCLEILIHMWGKTRLHMNDCNSSRRFPQSQNQNQNQLHQETVFLQFGVRRTADHKLDSTQHRCWTSVSYGCPHTFGHMVTSWPCY